LSSPLRRRLPNRRYATGSTNASRESERSATLCYVTFISLYLLITADMREHNKITGVWRTGMSTVPAAPPIKYILGYRSRTRTLNPNPNPITDPNPNFLFFYSILRWSVAGSTMRRQSSRIAAFLQANSARPIFCWPRSASTARSQVWLGLPDGRFQSGGSPRITAATARWWSTCGEQLTLTLTPKLTKKQNDTGIKFNIELYIKVNFLGQGLGL